MILQAFFILQVGYFMKKYMVGKIIAKKRKEKGLTQKELADKLHCTNKDVSKWELCDCYPDYELLGSLCKVLDISIAELFNTK